MALTGDQILSAVSQGAGTIFNQLGGAGSSGVNSPSPAGSITTSSAPPVGNSAAPPTTKAFPLWGYFAVAAGVLLVILLMRKG